MAQLDPQRPMRLRMAGREQPAPVLCPERVRRVDALLSGVFSTAPTLRLEPFPLARLRDGETPGPQPHRSLVPRRAAAPPAGGPREAGRVRRPRQAGRGRAG